MSWIIALKQSFLDSGEAVLHRPARQQLRSVQIKSWDDFFWKVHNDESIRSAWIVLVSNLNYKKHCVALPINETSLALYFVGFIVRSRIIPTGSISGLLTHDNNLQPPYKIWWNTDMLSNVQLIKLNNALKLKISMEHEVWSYTTLDLSISFDIHSFMIIYGLLWILRFVLKCKYYNANQCFRLSSVLSISLIQHCCFVKIKLKKMFELCKKLNIKRYVYNKITHWCWLQKLFAYNYC